jgi:hypothetical protein
MRMVPGAVCAKTGKGADKAANNPKRKRLRLVGDLHTTVISWVNPQQILAQCARNSNSKNKYSKYEMEPEASWPGAQVDGAAVGRLSPQKAGRGDLCFLRAADRAAAIHAVSSGAGAAESNIGAAGTNYQAAEGEAGGYFSGEVMTWTGSGGFSGYGVAMIESRGQDLGIAEQNPRGKFIL